jgi:predicted aspartyl protease
VTQELDYDDGYEPPAPILPLRIADPSGAIDCAVPGFVDSGADCTLIPATLAQQLRLPVVGQLEIVGVGGGRGIAPIHAASVQVAGTNFLTRLVAFEDEVILGRDLLNRIVLLLDGPRLRLRCP